MRFAGQAARRRRCARIRSRSGDGADREEQGRPRPAVRSRKRASSSAALPVEARDLDEALQIAARVPSARTGSVEVRPLVTTCETPITYLAMTRVALVEAVPRGARARARIHDQGDSRRFRSRRGDRSRRRSPPR